MKKQPIEEMLIALELEIKAVSRRGGARSIEIRGGEYQGSGDNRSLYMFVVGLDVYLRDDYPIRLNISNQTVDGSVVSLGEGSLLVALDEYVGPSIPFATLISDDSFLLEQLKTKLTAVQSGSVSFDHTKANQVIGETPITITVGKMDRDLEARGKQLNKEQTDAIHHALNNEVTHLWGPPGTGKTTVLSRIIEEFYRAGSSILLVSNTNIAVDTALEMVAEGLQDDPDFHKGSVLRYGPIVKPELKHRFGEQVNMDSIIARLGTKLSAELETLQSERTDAEAKAAPIHKLIDQFLSKDRVNELIKHLTRSLARLRNSYKTNEERIKSAHDSLDRLTHDLVRAKNSGLFMKLISGLNPESILRDTATVKVTISSCKDASNVISRQIQDIQTQIDMRHVELDGIQGKIPPSTSLQNTRDALAAIQTRTGVINSRMNEIQTELNALREQVFKNCRVVAATAYRTFLEGQIERSFDVVVLDEASMLTLPMSFYAAGLATKHVIVAGDFRQLPSITMSNEPQVLEWMKSDVFHKTGIATSISKPGSQKSLVTLKQQYRMHEDICDIANSVFYPDHPLVTPTEILTRGGDNFPLSVAPIIYIDTSEFHPWTALQSGTWSRYNILHALLIRNIVSSISEAGYLDETKTSGNALGIVTPFAAQTRLIQRMLEERIGPSAGSYAATVHRFQGNEKNTVIIDLTDSLGTRPSVFIQSTDVDQDGARLLNVAFTRGRYHIIVIANFRYIKENTPPNGITQQILDFVQGHGEQLQAEGILSLGPDDWFDGLKALTPPQIVFDPNVAGAFTEGTFYPAFNSDLEAASNSIVIFSPFLTSNGSGRYIDRLRAKQSHGTKIRLVTRPPDNDLGIPASGLTEIISGIRELGITVDFRSDMHEKFAIIDGRILWHGSLNILSHRNTSESMLRIPSEAACVQLTRFFLPHTKDNESDSKAVGEEFAGQENKDCPDCNGPTDRRTGRYGPYYLCVDDGCGGKVDGRSGRVSGRRPLQPQSSGNPSVESEVIECRSPR